MMKGSDYWHLLYAEMVTKVTIPCVMKVTPFIGILTYCVTPRA